PKGRRRLTGVAVNRRAAATPASTISAVETRATALAMPPTTNGSAVDTVATAMSTARGCRSIQRLNRPGGRGSASAAPPRQARRGVAEVGSLIDQNLRVAEAHRDRASRKRGERPRDRQGKVDAELARDLEGRGREALPRHAEQD